MLNHINQLSLVGFIADDVKALKTKGGEPMAIVRIGTTEQWQDKDNMIHKKTLWNSVMFFGKMAEACAVYRKGMVVQITAEVGEKKFTEGEKTTYKTVIQGKHIIFLEAGNQNRPGPEIDSEHMPS